MVPKIDNEFVCIVNREDSVLASVVSSYLNKPSLYLPCFVFPYVASSPYDVEINDENYVMVTRAREFKTRTSNAIKALGGCKYLILVGINEEQKSYLNFLKEYNTIEVREINEVDNILRSLIGKTEYLTCREEQVFIGSYLASREGKLLKIDANATNLNLSSNKAEGLICIENRKNAHTLIGVNYALSISADLSFIEPADVDEKEIQGELADWDATGDRTKLNNVGAIIFPTVEHIKFDKYSFATFFTGGIPYPLVLENIIPFTCVHNGLHPDFFVFNNLYYEYSKDLPSAVVFSPLEFGTDEETIFLIKKLEEKKYYVGKLIGDEASTTNIENYVPHFPYSILHLCSHGGEIEGVECQVKFKDRDSNEHIVEFDEIFTFAGGHPDGLIQVTSKWYIRKFNGLIWRSAELKSRNYPHYVFSDMTAAISADKSRRNGKKKIIKGSSAIKCKAFSYFAEFNAIAGWHCSPFIFNNTCWSSYEISHSFLSSGCRGYIGTLWGVGNAVAKQVAETFYKNAFNMSVFEALQIALVHTMGNANENIYIFWGLHSTKIREGNSIGESRQIIAEKINTSLRIIRKHISTEANAKVIERWKPIIHWNFNQLVKHFFPEAVRMGYIKFKK